MTNICQLIGLLQGFSVPNINCALVGRGEHLGIIWSENQTCDEVSVVLEGRRNDLVFSIAVEPNDSVTGSDGNQVVSVGGCDDSDFVTDLVLEGDSVVLKVDLEECSSLKKLEFTDLKCREVTFDPA